MSQLEGLLACEKARARTFTPAEIAWCQSRGESAGAAFARLFAAKEALIKAMRAPEGRFCAIEIVHDADGAPSARWSKLPEHGEVSISMAYSHPFAIATVAVAWR